MKTTGRSGVRTANTSANSVPLTPPGRATSDNKRAGVENLECRYCIFHGDHAITQAFDNGDRQVLDFRIILDHQDGRTLAGRGPRLRRRGVGMFLRICVRQEKAYRRVLARLALDGRVAAGLLGEAVNHREPEAQALADILGGKKGSKVRAFCGLKDWRREKASKR